MKKGKVFGKGQLAVGVMVIALIAAVWLNTKYMPSSTKYLGEASYVSANTDEAVETAASSNEDYFASAKTEREESLNSAIETVKELLKSDNLTEKDKETALKQIGIIADNIAKETNIETLLKAKGFKEVVAVIGKDGINIVIKSDGLTTADTMQIQDIVTTESGLDLSKIKIIPIK